MNLGDFGVIAREVEASAGDVSTDQRDTFHFYGEEIRLRPEIPGYPMMRFAAVASGLIPLENGLEELGLFVKTVKDCVDPADWEKFETLAAQHGGPDVHLVLTELIKAIYSQWSQRPTKRPSDSSDGPPTGATTPQLNGKSSASSQGSKRAGSSSRKRPARTG